MSVSSDDRQGKARHGKYHLFKVALGLLAISLILYGRALLTSDVLAQADLLLTFPPWNELRPNSVVPPRNSLLSDQSFQVIPYLYYFKRAVSEGRVPLWNPHIMSGMPFLSNMQSAVFFPVYWLALVMPVPDALEWISVAKILLAGLGFYLFCLRALGVRAVPAFAGAVIYALCGFNTVWLFYAHTNVALLAGWLLLAMDRVITLGGMHSISLLALVVALAIFGGHPETVLHLLLIALIFAVFRVGSAGAGVFRSAGRLLAASLLGAALAGVLLLPFMETGMASATLAIRKFAEHPFLPWSSAVTALIPNYFGNPAAGFYRGPKNYNEIACFAGVSSLVLAGLAAAFARRRFGTWFGISVIGVCGTVAYGIPPVFRIFHLLPLYRYSLNTRMVLGVSLGLAVLAAIGLDAALEIEARKLWEQIRRATMYSAAAVVLMLSPFLAAALVRIGRDPPKLEYLVFETAVFFLTLALILGLMSCMIRFPDHRAGICAAWMLLVCAEMIHFSRNYNPTIPRADYAYHYLPSSIRFLQSHPTDRYIGLQFGELAPNCSMVYGIHDFRGYDFPEPLPYSEYFYSLVDGANPLNLTHDVSRWTPEAIRALGNAGVRYFAHQEAIHYPGMQLVHDDGMKIYEYEQALPRAYVAANTIAVATNREVLARMKSAEFNASITTLITLESPSSLLPRSSPPDAAVAIVSYEPERVVLQARSSQAAVVVLLDTALQGWRASVNGISTRIYTANGMFRAVAIPPGVSAVEFRYQPRSYALGKLASLGAVAIMLAGWARGRGIRRPSRTQPRS